MQTIFDVMMQTHVMPFFIDNGFETKDINSETNKKLGAESFYFHKIENDLNRNFYFETNYDNPPGKYQFTLSFGIYSYDFNRKIGFPTSDEPNGLGCTFSLSPENMSENREYWQELTTETDINAFAKNLLQRIQNTVNEFQNTVTVEDLLTQFLARQGSVNINYEYMIRYLKITDNQSLLDKYIAAIRSENNDGSDSSQWFLQQIENALSTVVLKQKVAQNFTEGMKVPTSWEKVLDWISKNPHTVIGGLFEVNENSNEMLPHWLDPKGKAIKSLAVIGENAAQDIFCIWQKDKKTLPVIWIGEAGIARIIAENIDDFIALLAVGYYEIEQGDYSKPPEFDAATEHLRNGEFQAFFRRTFKKEVEKTGTEIVARISTTHEEFFHWLCDNDAMWSQWR
jgi:hypothetical protein